MAPRAPSHLWALPSGDDAGSLVAGRPGDPLAAAVPGGARLSGRACGPPGDESRGAAARVGGTHVTDSVLRVCVQEIRAALGDAAAAPQYLETVGRQGYRFLVGETGRGPPGCGGPLVGRQATSTALEGWFQRAVHGTRQLVFVSGEAGVGKTTVVEMFLTRLAAGRERVDGAGSVRRALWGGGTVPALLRSAWGGWAAGRAGRILAVLRRYAPLWLVQLPGLVSEAELERLQRRCTARRRPACCANSPRRSRC